MHKHKQIHTHPQEMRNQADNSVDHWKNTKTITTDTNSVVGQLLEGIK